MNKLLKPLIIILILFVIIGSGYYLFKINIDNKKIEPKKEEKKKAEKIEQEITDLDLKEDLDQKIKSLFCYNYCEIDSDKDYYNGCLYSKDIITASDLSIKYRIYSLVSANSLAEQIEEEKQINNQTYLVNAKIEESKLKELYRKLYGEIDSYNPNSINELKNQFPTVLYNDNNFYLITSDQKKIISNEVITYNNKYTIKKDKAYVYVSTAFVKMIKNNDDEITNYEVYSDYNMTNLKEEGLYSDYQKESKKADESYLVETTFKVDKENYRNYNQYKFTFQKDANGNYFFEKLQLEK